MIQMATVHGGIPKPGRSDIFKIILEPEHVEPVQAITLSVSSQTNKVLGPLTSETLWNVANVKRLIKKTDGLILSFQVY